VSGDDHRVVEARCRKSQKTAAKRLPHSTYIVAVAAEISARTCSGRPKPAINVTGDDHTAERRTLYHI
jgi:hypothetical protein